MRMLLLPMTNDIKLVLNVGGTFKFTHLWLRVLTCFLKLSSLKFTHDCLFLLKSGSLFPKNLKIYSRAGWNFHTKRANLTPLVGAHYLEGTIKLMGPI